MGLLEGYFVPLHCFTLTPESFEEKVHNLEFAFELMQDAGLPKPKARPEGKSYSIYQGAMELISMLHSNCLSIKLKTFCVLLFVYRFI